MKGNLSYIKEEQKKIVDMVTKKFKRYYLTGGTALSFYFDHRFSEDMVFFTQDYKKKDSDQIMRFVSKRTGFAFKLDVEQDDPKLIPMKVYYLELKRGCILKVDFVQDFEKNKKRIKNGLHSVEDIYCRIIHAGRQSAKDLFDLYWLSKHYRPLSEFFFEYFSYDRVEVLVAWYRGFNRMNLKVELLDLVPKIDTAKAIRHLDDEILKKIPEKLI